jgi:hypothetical protein
MSRDTSDRIVAALLDTVEELSERVEELQTQLTALKSGSNAAVVIGGGSVVEFCTVERGVRIGARCLISHTQVLSGAVLRDDMFVNTLAVNFEGKSMFVTHLFCHKTDNVKAKDEHDSTIGGLLLPEAAKKLGREYGDLFDSDALKKKFW